MPSPPRKSQPIARNDSGGALRIRDEASIGT
jgi:hypothetical protein